MVDMANAIDFRLGHCDGNLHALRSKNEKSKNGLFMYMASYKKKSPDKYKIIKLFNFLCMQSKA